MEPLRGSTALRRPRVGGRAITARCSVLLAFMAVSSVGCSDTCADDIVSRVTSPDGRHVAVLFQRDCGATTGFSTQISIVDVGSKPVGGGNVFVADDDHGSARAGAWGGPWAEARWLQNDRLIVRYASKSRLFRTEAVVSGVRVIYRAADR